MLIYEIQAVAKTATELRNFTPKIKRPVKNFTTEEYNKFFDEVLPRLNDKQTKNIASDHFSSLAKEEQKTFLDDLFGKKGIIETSKKGPKRFLEVKDMMYNFIYTLFHNPNEAAFKYSQSIKLAEKQKTLAEINRFRANA